MEFVVSRVKMHPKKKAVIEVSVERNRLHHRSKGIVKMWVFQCVLVQEKIISVVPFSNGL